MYKRQGIPIPLGYQASFRKSLVQSFKIKFTPAIFAACALCIFVGCSGGTPVADEGTKQSANNLLEFYNAYVAYCVEEQTAPESQADLEPFFEPSQLPAVFSSKRDHKPFKVYWGTPIELASRKNNVIIAHEQEGLNGVRYVVTSFGITEMSDEEFQDTNLPAEQ